MLEVHPSEATTLLAAALDGVRGRVEIRDAGAKLNLTSQSADAFSLPSWSVAAINPLARALADSLSLDEASATTAAICGQSELDYERRKAAGRAAKRPAELDKNELARRIWSYTLDAVAEKVTLASFRRITDAIGLRTYDPALLRSAIGDAAHPWLPLILLNKYFQDLDGLPAPED